MFFTLPSKVESEEWFGRLRALILNIIEIGLLLFAAYEIAKNHVAPSANPPAVMDERPSLSSPSHKSADYTAVAMAVSVPPSLHEKISYLEKTRAKQLTLAVVNRE